MITCTVECERKAGMSTTPNNLKQEVGRSKELHYPDIQCPHSDNRGDWKMGSVPAGGRKMAEVTRCGLCGGPLEKGTTSRRMCAFSRENFCIHRLPAVAVRRASANQHMIPDHVSPDDFRQFNTER